MSQTFSKDGTPIAFERSGQGPTLVLVNGALSKKTDAAPAAIALSPYFTVFIYDRRGRGESGDTAPYAVEREIEDLQAVINEAGGKACVYGHSSGAVLALLSARQLPNAIQKLAVYEPPILVDDSRLPFAEDFLPRLKELVMAGKRGEAVAHYMRHGLLVSEKDLAAMQSAPIWPAFEAEARTLVYDSMIVEDVMTGQPLSKAKWGAISVPTLVMDGGNSPGFMHSGAEALTALLPHAQHHRFEGYDHHVANEVLVPTLVEFFKS
ncbi:MAG: alpha/beta hydrolase [Anaerolineaceae bacterium]|nr:alpha/beta hydrolase [Anaerolineaceae bacterium]